MGAWPMTATEAVMSKATQGRVTIYVADMDKLGLYKAACAAEDASMSEDFGRMMDRRISRHEARQVKECIGLLWSVAETDDTLTAGGDHATVDDLASSAQDHAEGELGYSRAVAERAAATYAADEWTASVAAE